MRDRINFSSPPWAERRRVLIAERDRLNYANFIPRMTELYGDRTAFVIDHTISYPGFEGSTVSYRDMNLSLIHI